jgi:hypothetical protein
MKLRLRYRQMVVPVMMVPVLLVGSCGGSSDEQASESTTVTEPGSASTDPSDAEADTDEQGACSLVSHEEISDATGFDVLSAKELRSAQPTCEWELNVPESSGARGLPMLKIELLTESEYRSRMAPMNDGTYDIDGPVAEVLFHYEPDSTSVLPLFAFDGSQGLQITAGFPMWDDEVSATSAMLDLTSKVFDRV